MSWKYRIREVRTTAGDHVYYPQYRHKWVPFWCHFRDYPGDTKVRFNTFTEACNYVDSSRANDEPEVSSVRNLYL